MSVATSFCVVPLTRYISTLATEPPASVAVATNGTVPPSVEPAAGASMLRIGGVLPVVLEMPPEMLMVICAEAVWLAESVTTAFSVCAPFVYFLLSMLQA